MAAVVKEEAEQHRNGGRSADKWSNANIMAVKREKPARKTNLLPADSKYMHCAEGESDDPWGGKCAQTSGTPKYTKNYRKNRREHTICL